MYIRDVPNQAKHKCTNPQSNNHSGIAVNTPHIFLKTIKNNLKPPQTIIKRPETPLWGARALARAPHKVVSHGFITVWGGFRLILIVFRKI